MSDMRTYYKITPITLLLLMTSSVTGEDASTSQRLNQVLDWLPTDSETIVVANGPFRFPQKLGPEQPFVTSARAISFGLVTHLRQGSLSKQLRGQKILMSVAASRRFSSPKGLGLMPYDGCHLLMFDQSAHETVKSAFEDCIKHAPKMIQIGEVRVASYTETYERDEWTTLVAMPQPDMLITATDVEFLQDVFSRMKDMRSKRAFPTDIPEWKHINVQSPVWGIRHYRKEHAATDPSSPLRPRAAANVPDSKATGFVFWYDSKSQTARARYLSRANNPVKIATQHWHHPSRKLTPTIKEIQAGVVDVASSVKGESGLMFLFVLMGCLGHGVYL